MRGVRRRRRPLEWTIKPDGTVDVVASMPRGAVTGTARMSVKGGKFFYESGTSSGTVTLQDDGNRRVLKYDAVFRALPGEVGAAIGALARRPQGSAMMFLLDG